jgi:hypothetical protein
LEKSQEVCRNGKFVVNIAITQTAEEGPFLHSLLCLTN